MFKEKENKMAKANSEDKNSSESGATSTTVVDDDTLVNGNNGEYSNESGNTPITVDKRKYKNHKALELMARLNVNKIYRVGEYWFTDLRAAEAAKAQISSNVKTFDKDE